MHPRIKISAIAAFAAAGFATAAFAQQGGAQDSRTVPTTEQHGHMVGQGSQMGHGMMDGMMMNDPEMRTEMVRMMRNCNQMMESMAEGQTPGRKPNG